MAENLQMKIWRLGGEEVLTNTAARLRTELGLNHRHSGIDNAHANPRNHSSDNHLSSSVRGSLQNSANNHDRTTDGNCFTAAEFLAKERCGKGSEEASDYGQYQ